MTACSPLTTDFGRGEFFPRPTYANGESEPVAGPRTVVHYSRTQPDAPPLADVAPRNGRPDYVEKIRDAAESALDFFGAPVFSGQPFRGFETELCDGGPDPRIDIYVKDLGSRGTLGRAVPPTRAERGAFLLISPDLQDRPRGTPRLFQGDGIRFTVAHELFHLVQFRYVPEGMPNWVAEGTANTLAFLFDGVDHPVLLAQADRWLRAPWRPLWYPDFNCDRCYGGVWWWAVFRDVLRPYFERLGEYYRDPAGVGIGIAALEAVFQERDPEYSVFASPALQLQFAFAFAAVLPQAAYPRTLRPPPVRYRLSATPTKRTRRLVLNPMSVHYISISTPANSVGLEVVARATEGPDPIATLLAGYRRRAAGRAVVSRVVNACVVTFPPTYGSFTNRIGLNFRTRAERAYSLLAVANRSTVTVRYELSLTSTRRPVAAPSPAESDPPLCTKQSTVGSARDAIGDGSVAPDISRVDVALTSAANVPGRLVTFAVGFGNRRELVDGDLVVLVIDTDRNPSTGCAPAGAEYALVVLGQSGPDTARLARCRTGELDVGGAQGTFQARFDERRATLLLVTSASDLGGSSAFNFRVDASAPDPSGERRLDSSPDGTNVFCFPSCRPLHGVPRAALPLQRLSTP